MEPISLKNKPHLWDVVLKQAYLADKKTALGIMIL